MLYHRRSGPHGKKKKKEKDFCPFSFGVRESHGLRKKCGIQVLKNQEFHKLSDSGIDMYPDIYQVCKVFQVMLMVRTSLLVQET